MKSLMKRSAFLAAGIAASAAPSLLSAQTLQTVRVGTTTTESYALSIYAKEQGFFSRNGIDAQILYIPGASGGITAALVGGALDVGCISMGPTSNAHLRGIPIELLAPGGIVLSEASTTSLVVARNSPITSARDVNGKTVGTVVLRDVITVAVAKWLDLNGGDSKTVKFVEMPMTDGPPGLVAGRIDAYALGEPFLTNTAAQVRPIGNIYDAFGKRTMISMHIAMSDWLAKNGDAARRVRTALREAAQWANNPGNRTARNAILARETKIPLDILQREKHVVYGETLDVALIQPQIDALAEYKYIDRRFDVSEIIWKG
jgi:NitT/TauT family transport system substrate-binding protein